MEVIPAIDIRGGKAVRLFQGDYGRETVYDDSPVDAARRWLDIGATRLHVVDLDGARTGEQVNISLVERIAALSQAPVQLGGGIRTVQSAQRAVDIGVERVIAGTAALEDVEFVRGLVGWIGADRVIVGVDARDGFVAVRGWVDRSATPAADLVERVEAAGVPRVVYTDIARDGTLTEPNFDQLGDLMRASSVKMLAAGGISRIKHLRRLADMGVEGAVVGTAAYTGDIDMKGAIAELADTA